MFMNNNNTVNRAFKKSLFLVDPNTLSEFFRKKKYVICFQFSGNVNYGLFLVLTSSCFCKIVLIKKKV